MVMGSGGGGDGDTASLGDNDVPYAIRWPDTNESLGMEASAQEVDTPEPLPALNWVRAYTPLECLEDLHLSRLAHGLVFSALDCRAKVEVDRQ